MFVLRVLYSRPALIVLTAALLALGGFATLEHLSQRIEQLRRISVWPEGQDDALSIILITYGVMLEERDALYQKIYGRVAEGAEGVLNHQAHVVGALILIAGLFIELFDVTHGIWDELQPLLAQGTTLLILALHAAGLWLLARFLYMACRVTDPD
jgi:hypothetical protein